MYSFAVMLWVNLHGLPITEDVLRAGTLDENMELKSRRNGGIASLWVAVFLYTQGVDGQNGDVRIEGSSSFLDTT